MNKPLTDFLRRIFSPATALAMAILAAVSCNANRIEPADPAANGEDDAAVEGVSLSETAITLPMGTTYVLTAQVRPENAANKDVIWKSSDKTVATVDKGVVKGLQDGTATVTATTTDGNFTAQCAVTVATVLPEILRFETQNQTIAVGQTWYYTEDMNPDNSNIGLLISTDSPDVIELSPAERTVKGLRPGIAKLTVTTFDKKLSAHAWIKVVEKVIYPTSFGLYLDEDYEVGTSFLFYNYTSSSSPAPRLEWAPAEANWRDFTLTSTDEAVASVEALEMDKYRIRFNQIGSTRLEVSSFYSHSGGFTNLSKKKDIHVVAGKPSITINTSDLDYWRGYSLYLIPNRPAYPISISYQNTTDRHYVITNPDEFAPYLSISSDRITGKKAGNTKIKLRSAGNYSSQVEIYVNIVPPPTGIGTSVAGTLEIQKGKTAKVWLYPNPEETVGRFTVKTSNNRVSAKIVGGVFEPVPFTPFPKNYRTLEITASNTTGTCTVTVTHQDDTSVSTSIPVTVTN